MGTFPGMVRFSNGPRLAASLLAVAGLAGPVAAESELARCLDAAGLPRVVRMVSLDGGGVGYARVVSQEDGVPTVVSPLAAAGDRPGHALALAAEPLAADAPRWRLDASSPSAALCSPVGLGQAEIDAESRVVVAAGLNYAAHADEAGGGDVFLFPKPVAPGPPYGPVAAPDAVTLLDYEVELGFVLLEDLDLTALPSRDALLAQSAFFVTNDLTDREPIIVHKALTGPGTGFIDAKGRAGFLPAGPWMVRGTELFAGLAACGATGLGLRLEVDEGAGFERRQDATTAAMILDPLALLRRIADEAQQLGPRTPMPQRRADPWRYYPIAVAGPNGRLTLPAGSIVLTGTPDGVALQAPDPLGAVARGVLNLRGPFEQFRQEELERVASGEAGGYLAVGDRVRARIDGLGAQIFRIVDAPSAGSRAETPGCSPVPY